MNEHLIQEHWQEIIERVGNKKMSLAAYLSNTEPMFTTQSRVIINVPNHLTYDVLNMPDNQRILEEALAEFAHQEHVIVQIFRYKTLPRIVIKAILKFNASLKSVTECS